MADAAVSFVAERLGALLIEKASSLKSVSKNVKRLKSEFIHMQGFLKAADAWPHRNNEELQNLVAEIRDLAHDAEDIIESRAFAAKKCILSRMINSWSVASEIDEFRSKINDLGGRLQRYGNGIITREAVEHRPGTAQQNLLQPLRRTYSHTAEQHAVIGLEKDAEKIATELVDGTHRTVSICGMGGIGKTTLAKKIYHNARARKNFKCAWGSVSQQCNIRDIWLKILKNLAAPNEREGRFSELMDEEIAKELYELLMKEKCLVVLDDIWTKGAWDGLRAGFPEGNTESKILLTTRNKDVALHVDPNCFIHSPRCLNESQSWELFRSVAIPHREEAGFTFDENLEELGRRIVNRCGGLPLAIKTIGGNLQTKSSIDEWTMVYNNMVSHLSGINNILTEFQIMSLLALSYHDLPYQLKQCFHHFSHFPDDFIIPVDTIINIWVAEGIISKGSRGKEPIVEVEDIAYAYLESLASRCIIQVEKWSSIGKIKSCRLHDLMRDLCIQEAKKENFVHLENGHHDEATMHSTSIGKFRHLALCMKNSNQGPNLNDDIYDHVRSLLVFCNNMDQVVLNKSLLVAMTRPFKYLRLLYLDGGKLDLEMPEAIGYLVHLRLFDMGSMCIKHLPSSLGKLTQLLTLKLGHLLNVGRMPNIFENMHQLRHLYLPASSKLLLENMKLSHLRNLQTLVNPPLKSRRIEDLVGLSSLRKLKLEVLEQDEFELLVDEMFNTSPNATFDKLRSLSVGVRYGNEITQVVEITKVAATCPHLHKLKFSGPLVLDLPERSQMFCQLNKLKLYYSNFVEDPMPHLGRLPNLRVLLLHSTLKREAIMCPKNSFPYLQSLVLEREGHLKEWITEEGALPFLSVLELAHCDNLKILPGGKEFEYVNARGKIIRDVVLEAIIKRDMNSLIKDIDGITKRYVDSFVKDIDERLRAGGDLHSSVFPHLPFPNLTTLIIKNDRVETRTEFRSKSATAGLGKGDSSKGWMEEVKRPSEIA